MRAPRLTSARGNGRSRVFLEVILSMKDVVIVAAVRTPVGKFQGAFAEMTAVQLGAMAVREAVKRAGIDAGELWTSV